MRTLTWNVPLALSYNLPRFSLHAIPQKSPCQPNLLECSRLGTRFQVPILYALTLLARVSQVETPCPHRVSFALLRVGVFGNPRTRGIEGTHSVQQRRVLIWRWQEVH